jgi:hypothetical protein
MLFAANVLRELRRSAILKTLFQLVAAHRAAASSGLVGAPNQEWSAGAPIPSFEDHRDANVVGG